MDLGLSTNISVTDGSGAAGSEAPRPKRGRSQDGDYLIATQQDSQSQGYNNKGWGKKKWDKYDKSDKKTDDTIRMLTKLTRSNAQDLRSTKAVVITTYIVASDQPVMAATGEAGTKYAAAIEAIPKAQRRDNPIASGTRL